MNDAKPHLTELQATFIAKLCTLAGDEKNDDPLKKDRKKNSGALAALRASLIAPNGMAAAAGPYVVPYLPEKEWAPRDRLYFLVAALFALHPDAGGDGVSLGRAFRAINDVQQGGPGKGDNESLRGRFVALLDAHPEDLPHHLRHAVSLARARQQPLDWGLLLSHVLAWDHPSRWVQARLARDFWNATTTATENQGDTSR